LESNNFGIISKGGQYKFGIQSDDGVRLHINNKVIINSPKKRKGYSNWIFKTGKVQFDKIGQHSLKLEYFEKQGASGVMLKYSGADTGGKWAISLPNMFQTLATQRSEQCPVPNFQQLLDGLSWGRHLVPGTRLSCLGPGSR
jgi:hypothetical protein